MGQIANCKIKKQSGKETSKTSENTQEKDKDLENAAMSSIRTHICGELIRIDEETSLLVQLIDAFRNIPYVHIVLNLNWRILATMNS